jgi:glycosyltransferase involved in cell wall biosynthesis
VADSCGKPLVTFYVVAYNQARFVREAVESALAQTYSPMEIVLSDDCSTDLTFEIMQDVVKRYPGPHKVILNRNERNLGLSEHVNRIIETASGELIVAADGDDVSGPQRTERCVEVWLANGKPAALASSVCCIDAAGNPSKTKDGQWFAQFLPAQHETPAEILLRYSAQGSPRLITCCAAWTKEMCNAFGPLPPGIWHEDDVITLRAWLFDRIVFIPEALVSYREHDSNIFNRVHAPLTTLHARQRAEQVASTEAQRRRESLLSYMPDLDLAVRQQWITRRLCETVKRVVETRCRSWQVIEDWWNVRWTKRVALFCFIVRSGHTREVRWCTTRLLPFPVFVALGAIWSRLRMLGFRGMDDRDHRRGCSRRHRHHAVPEVTCCRPRRDPLGLVRQRMAEQRTRKCEGDNGGCPPFVL